MKNNKTQTKTVLHGRFRAVLLAVLFAVQADVVLATDTGCEEPNCEGLLLAAYVGAVNGVRPKSATDGRSTTTDYLAADEPVSEPGSAFWDTRRLGGGQSTQSVESPVLGGAEIPGAAVREVVASLDRETGASAHGAAPDTNTGVEATGGDELGLPESTIALLLALVGLVAVTRRQESDAAPERAG